MTLILPHSRAYPHFRRRNFINRPPSLGTNASCCKPTAPGEGGIHRVQPRGGRLHVISLQGRSPCAIYCAVTDTDQIQLFDIHENPNDGASSGHTSADTHRRFGQAERGHRTRTRTDHTLADCIEQMRSQISLSTATERPPMKAAILTCYDKNAADLELRNIPTPTLPGVLIKIHTAAVNPLDNMICAARSS